MLTRKEVLLQLKRVGITEASRLKNSLRDFEKYIAESHGVPIIRTKKILGEELTSSEQGEYQNNFHGLSGTHKQRQKEEVKRYLAV